MPMPTAAELLNVWEAGAGLMPAQRAFALCLASAPAASPAEVARMPLGRRDASLLTLREQLFGSEIESLAACPECGEHLELAFRVDDVRTETPVELETLRFGNCVIEFRAVSTLDLLETRAAGAGGRLALLDRVTLGAEIAGETVALSELPEPAIEALEAALEGADPQAEVQLALDCPACGHAWLALLDIASYLWLEIDSWANRILREVHSLAGAYGWTEAEVLKLSARRRQHYLELIGS